jgi:hypothetical protein
MASPNRLLEMEGVVNPNDRIADIEARTCGLLLNLSGPPRYLMA